MGGCLLSTWWTLNRLLQPLLNEATEPTTRCPTRNCFGSRSGGHADFAASGYVPASAPGLLQGPKIQAGLAPLRHAPAMTVNFEPPPVPATPALDPLAPALRVEHLFVNPFGALAEDLQTALLAEALNPLRDAGVARLMRNAFMAALRAPDLGSVRAIDEVLHPRLLTGPGRPDLLLVNERMEVRWIVENKINAQGNRRKDGEDQLDAYVRAPQDYVPAPLTHDGARFVMLNASGDPNIGRLFPYAKTRQRWNVAAHADVADHIETAITSDTVLLDHDARAFLSALVRELRLGAGGLQQATHPIVDAALLAEQSLMGRAYAPPVVRARARLLTAWLSAPDPTGTAASAVSAAVDATKGSCSGWSYSSVDRWLRHRLSHDSSGVTVEIGVPDPDVEAPVRVMGVLPVPSPGPLGRLLVDAGNDAGAALRTRLSSAMATLCGAVSPSVVPVQYPPWERILSSGREAIGFYGFDPLKGPGPLIESHAAALTAAAASVIRTLSTAIVEAG